MGDSRIQSPFRVRKEQSANYILCIGIRNVQRCKDVRKNFGGLGK